MEKSFTLAQVLSAGAVGLATGLLIAHTAIKQKESNPEKKKKSTSKKADKEGDRDSKSKKESNKEEKIEDDSEEYTDEDAFTDDEESEDEENEDLAEFDLHEEYKMVLVVRSDLGMGKGKAAAQCCHATLANYKELAKKSPQTLTRWEYCGQAKVTLKVDNEEDMLLLQAQAMSIGLAAHSIRDAGRTQIAAGSRTVLAVGPGPVSVVDSVTGKLKLY
ncbi:hypothetical protein BGZ83_006235 [Gryganskiella cystojenkinii]|nr:hypothetical protein BGZ83_006235 [Gryganskiella cystojenkinii]